MESRTTGAINIGPTDNLQGACRFLSLKTGELIVRQKWTELPRPLDVIDHLDISGRKWKCVRIINGCQRQGTGNNKDGEIVE